MDLKKMFATIDCRKLISVTFVGFVLMTLPVTSTVGQATTRFWSDNSGTFSTEATLVKINSATVTLKKTNQVVIEVPFSRLSENDLDFVKNEIQRRNGVAAKPPQNFSLDRQLAQPGVSSRNKPNTAPDTIQKTAKVAESNVQAPLRYSPQPDDFQPEPLDAVDPILPDAIAAAVPTKDTVTSPPSDVARLAAPNLPMKDFSLGHPGPKKPPIMLKSSPKFAAAEKEAESFLEIKSTYTESNPEMASFEASPSSNELRNSQPLSPPKDISTSSTNDLRSQPLKPNQNQNQFQLKTSPRDVSNGIEDTISLETDIPPTDFSRETFSTTDPAIVILEKETPTAAPKAIPEPSPLAPKATSREEPDSAKTDFKKPPTFSFDAAPEESENVFSRPPNFGPRKTSFEGPAKSDPATADQSLANLPPRYETLARKISGSDQRAVRSALLEVQNSWPSQRYPALVEVIRESAKAPKSATRVLAIETLALRDQENSLSYILAGIEDDSISVRESTYKLIEKLTNPAVIPALTERLDSDKRERVARSLAKLGPDVEAHIIPLLNHKSIDTQLTVCDLLGSVGRDKGIKALQTLIANSKQARVRLQASNAIDRINRRLESAR